MQVFLASLAYYILSNYLRFAILPRPTKVLLFIVLIRPGPIPGCRVKNDDDDDYIFYLVPHSSVYGIPAANFLFNLTDIVSAKVYEILLVKRTK